jgi:dephospho-CoA kinase
MTIVIGLTGNIATGKSAVMRMLADLGAHIIDADAVAHQVVAPDGPAYQAVLAAFGADLAGADGSIDRGRLGRIVFADPSALARLEGIIHPAVFDVVEREVRQIAAEAAAGAPEPVIVIEAIKLLEAGMSATLCHQVWVVTATPERQLRRLTKARGMKEEEARQRMAAQGSQDAKISRADVVIENSSTRAAARAQVKAAWAAHVEPRRRNVGEKA